MTTRKYSSKAQQTTLASSINATVTSMTVVNGPAVMGGKTLTGTETYTVVIDPDTALEEIVNVTVYASGNTLTIARGIDSASPGTGSAHSAGAVVRHMAIGRDYQEANDHIEASAAVHGLSGSVVGTTDTQTLTNKTLTSPVITSLTLGDGNIVFEGATADAFETTLTVVDPTADRTVTIPDATTTLVGTDTTQTLTNKTLTSPTITGTGAIAGTFTGNLTGNVTGNVTGSAGSATGNAATATALATARTFQLTGDVEASGVTFDGTGNVSLTTAIGTGAIVNADVNASAAIAKTKLDLGGTITSADLVDGTIVNADINASAAIALSKLATDPLARANHTGTQAASTISDFDTQVRTSRLDQMAAPTAAVSLNSQKITNLASPVDNGDAVSLGYLAGQKGSNDGIASLDSSGKLPTSQLPALAISTVYVVASEAAMLALPSDIGEIAIRTDVSKSFILSASPASTLANWKELLTPPDAVLSVDGSTGAVSLSGTYINRTTGQLLGNLDANTHTVTGLGTPTNNTDAATKAYVDTVAGSATAAAASATAAAASYDSFDDRYLGAKASAPTLDNDGNALIEGALYWNSVSNQMFAWTGSAWGSISSTADIYRYRYTATGGETSKSGTDDNGLTLSYIVGKEQVYLNGVLLVRSTDYVATDGSSIASLAALTSGDILEIITFTAFDLANVISPTLFDAKGDILVATSADTAGKLTVGTNGQVLKANSATATGLEWAADNTYSAPTLGSTSIASGATVTTIEGLTLTSPVINSPKVSSTYSAKTASYTFASGDEGNIFSMNNAATQQFNIPTDATFNFAVGTEINVFWITGAGQPTIGAVTPGTTTVISTGATSATPKLRVVNAGATCKKLAADTWIVFGDLA